MTASLNKTQTNKIVLLFVYPTSPSLLAHNMVSESVNCALPVSRPTQRVVVISY